MFILVIDQEKSAKQRYITPPMPEFSTLKCGIVRYCAKYRIPGDTMKELLIARRFFDSFEQEKDYIINRYLGFG